MSENRPNGIQIVGDIRKGEVLHGFGDKDPSKVVNKTYQSLRLIWQGDDERYSARDYIHHVALPQFQFVAGAIPYFFNPLKPGAMKEANIIGALPRDEAVLARASVDYFSLIFGSLPDSMEYPSLPSGLFRQILAPPTSQEESVERVLELRDTIRGFSEGSISPTRVTFRTKDRPVVRTLAFLKTGSDFAISLPTSKTEYRDMVETALQETSPQVEPEVESTPEIRYQRALGKLNLHILANERKKRKARERLLKGVPQKNRTV